MSRQDDGDQSVRLKCTSKPIAKQSIALTVKTSKAEVAAHVDEGAAWIGVWRCPELEWEERLFFGTVGQQRKTRCEIYVEEAGEYVVQYHSSNGGWSEKARIHLMVEDAREVTGCTAALPSMREYGPDGLLFVRNPERGFYPSREASLATQGTGGWSVLCDALGRVPPLQSGPLDCYAEDVTVLFRNVVLGAPALASDTLPKAALDNLRRDLQSVRRTGKKVVLRFCYNTQLPSAPPYNDCPEVTRVIAHIKTLAPVLQDFSCVIMAVQAGFVGTWGEWFYTDHYNDDGGWSCRTAIIAAMLRHFPTCITLRTPAYKRTITGCDEPLGHEEAYSTSMAARLGHHNDAFLSDDTDMGTGSVYGADGTFLKHDTRYVLMMGETAVAGSPSRFSDTQAAISRLQRDHWTLLNMNWTPSVLDKFQTLGCLDDIRRRLGYRFVAISSSVEWTGDDQTLLFRLSLRNDGFAACLFERPVLLVLRGESTNTTVKTTADARAWTPGEHVMEAEFCAPPTPGRYHVFMSLPDNSRELAEDPRYSVAFCNTQWEACTGMNDLEIGFEVNG